MEAAGGVVKGLCVPDGGRLSNSRLKPKGDVAAEALAAGAGALIYMRWGQSSSNPKVATGSTESTVRWKRWSCRATQYKVSDRFTLL